MDPQSTQFQQGQLAMILGPDPSHFETLISHLMSSSNELQSQAESFLNFAKRTDPKSLSLKLAHHLLYCPSAQLRTMSAILVPRLLTGDDCYLYPTQPFKPVPLTSIQQAQLAMVLGPDPSHFETLISHLMSPSNEVRSQAEPLFNLAKQTHPNSFSLKLAHHLHFCPPAQLRTMCSILLPKLLTDGSYIYPSVLLTSNHLEEDENDAGIDNVSKLQESQSYKGIMQKVEDALQKGYDISYQGMVLEDHPEYQLILDCNSLSVEIENEIMIIHNFICGKYHVKFPELESLVHHPIDYARVVKKIGNEMDLTLVDLEGLLPSGVVMVVSVAASTTSGKPLPQEDLNKTIDACDRVLAHDFAKKKVLDFVESRMGYIAPNLSAFVGSTVAAKLMGIARLSTLAKMPICGVQLLGAKKRTAASATFQFPGGYLEQTEVFQTTAPSLRSRVWWGLAKKSSLAALVDSTGGDPSGNTGRAFREEIRKKIEKWPEPPPPKREPLPVKMKERYTTMDMRKLPNRMSPAKEKLLPVPRKMKERHAKMDMRKLANRMQFGVPEESSLGNGRGKAMDLKTEGSDGLGEGYGSQNCQGYGGTKEKIVKSEICWGSK